MSHPDRLLFTPAVARSSLFTRAMLFTLTSGFVLSGCSMSGGPDDPKSGRKTTPWQIGKGLGGQTQRPQPVPTPQTPNIPDVPAADASMCRDISPSSLPQVELGHHLVAGDVNCVARALQLGADPNSNTLRSRRSLPNDTVRPLVLAM